MCLYLFPGIMQRTKKTRSRARCADSHRPTADLGEVNRVERSSVERSVVGPKFTAPLDEIRFGVLPRCGEVFRSMLGDSGLEGSVLRRPVRRLRSALWSLGTPLVLGTPARPSHRGGRLREALRTAALPRWKRNRAPGALRSMQTPAFLSRLSGCHQSAPCFSLRSRVLFSHSPATGRLIGRRANRWDLVLRYCFPRAACSGFNPRLLPCLAALLSLSVFLSGCSSILPGIFSTSQLEDENIATFSPKDEVPHPVATGPVRGEGEPESGGSTTILSTHALRRIPLHTGAISDIVTSADGNSVYTAGEDGNVYHVTLGAVRKQIPAELRVRRIAAAKKPILGLALSPSGKGLAVALTSAVYVINLEDGTSLLIVECSRVNAHPANGTMGAGPSIPGRFSSSS